MRRDSRYCASDAPCWPPRGYRRSHSFFFRIAFLFCVVGVATILTFVFSADGFTANRFLHFFGGVFLVLMVVFFVLRRMFNPLRLLMRGVEEISNGNLDFQFPAGHHGEFHYLAGTFNAMARRIKEMVDAKSQLLLDVSHELRSPLTRLKVALEMIPASKLRKSMAQDVAEMETMLAEILDTEQLRSNHGKLALAPFDVTTLLRDLAKQYKTRAPGVKLIGNPAKVQLVADEARVRTVLRNVLENALKYSAEQPRPVELSLETSANEIDVVIRDYGVGIPTEDQAKVFEPFYRVDKSRTKETGGYGLGLGLCQEIMHAHGGTISLNSESAKGTTVVLTFPK